MKTLVITKPSEFREWCSNLESTWAFDCETTSLQYLDLEIIGFSMCDGRQACYVNILPKHKKELLQILDYHISEAKMVVFHNASFDMMCLQKEGIGI